MNKRLFVGGIPFKSTEEDLKALFAKYGNVVSVVIIKYKYSGRSKGFGFVEMETEEEAKKAMEALNDSEMEGRKITVNEAKPREEN
jgi:RNA recognition motif-containing protein